MSFFQNPFYSDFKGYWLLADRKQTVTFTCPSNSGRSAEQVVSWRNGPFDLSVNDADGNPRNILNIYYSLHFPFERWVLLSVDVSATAASTSAVRSEEIVTDLNADSNFSAWFIANLNTATSRVQIKSKKPDTEFRFYVANGGAEEVLKFNERAGIAEMPTYFNRHRVCHLFSTVDEFESFPDRMNQLILLDPYNYLTNPTGSSVDAEVIESAVDFRGNSLNLDPDTVQADWQLLKGQSGLFMFQKICLDSDEEIAQIIEYHAGAKVGDMAKKICYLRDGNKNPIQITEEPYTLTVSDLITPDCSECTS